MVPSLPQKRHDSLPEPRSVPRGVLWLALRNTQVPKSVGLTRRRMKAVICIRAEYDVRYRQRR